MKTSLYDQEYIQNMLLEEQSTTNQRYVNSISHQMKKSYQLKEYNQNYSSKTSQQKTQQSLSEKSYNELKNNLLANKSIDPFMKNNISQQGPNVNRLSPSKQQNIPKHNEQISIQNHSNNYSQIKENIRPTSTDLTSQYLSQKLSTSNVYNKLDKQKYRVGTLPSDDNSFDKFDYLLANDTYKKPIGRQSTIVSSTSNSQQNYNDQENIIDYSQKHKQISTGSSTILQKKYYQTRGRESQKESINANVKQSNNLNQEKIVEGGGTGGGLLATTATYSQTPNNKHFQNQMNTISAQNQNQMIGTNQSQNPSNTFQPGNYQSYTLNNARPQSQYAPRSSNIENKSISLENFEFAREKKKMNLKEIELKLINRQQSRDKNSTDFENTNNVNQIKHSVPSTTTGTMYSNYLLEKQKLMDSSELNNNITSTIKNSFLNYKQRSEKNSKISINPAVSLDLQKYGSQRIPQNQNQISQQQETSQQLSTFEVKKNSVSSVNTTTTESYQQNQIQGQNRLSQKSTSTNTSTSINATLSNNNPSSNQTNYEKNDSQMKTLKKQNFKKDSLQNIEDFQDNLTNNNQEITLAQKIQQSQIQLQNQEQMYRNLNSKNNAKFFNNYVSDDKFINNNMITMENDKQQQQEQKMQKQVQDKSESQPTTFLKFNNNNDSYNKDKLEKQIQNKQQQNVNKIEESNNISNNNNVNLKLNYRSSTPQNKSHTELKKQPQQNSVQSTQKKRDEYQEYKKLQEKLNFLENKILSIKTNIEINQNSQLANATTAITEKHHKQLTQQSGLSHQKLLQQKDLRLSMDKQISKRDQENTQKNQPQKVNQNSSQLSKEDNNQPNGKAQQQLNQSQKKNSFFSPSNKIYQTLHTGQTPKTSTNHLNDGGFAFFANNNNSSNNNKEQQQQQKNLLNNSKQSQQQQQGTTGQSKHLKKVQQSTEQINTQLNNATNTQASLINSNSNNNKMTKSQQITTYQKIMQKNDNLRQSTAVTTTNQTNINNNNTLNSNNNMSNLKTTSTLNNNNNNTQFNKPAKTSNYSQYQQQQINQNQKTQQDNEATKTSPYTNSMQNLLTSQQNYQQQQQQQIETLNSKPQSQPQNIGVGLQSLVTQINKGNFLPSGFSTTNKQFQKIQSEQIQQKNAQSQQNEKPQQQQQSIPKSFLNNKNNEKNSKKSSQNISQLQQQQYNTNNSTQKQTQNSNNNNSNLATTHLTAYRKSQIQKENQQNKEIMEKRLIQQCKNLYYLPKVIHSFIEEGEITYFVQLFREHLVQTMQAINFSKFLRPVSQKIIDEKKQNFVKKNYYKDKKTLIFDLDETLIHCNDNINVPSDVVLPIQFPNGSIIEAGINIRPYTIECLKELSLYYEIIVFTASHSCYANVVLDYLDPNQEYIQHRLFREQCVQTDEGIYIKDLRVIANRDLNNVIIIDNAAYSFGFHINNGIPIIPYYDNKEDTELKDLTNYLKKIHQEDNISYINSLVFKLSDFADHSDPTVLAQVIYQDLLNSNQFDSQQ